ncbi:hypothetical protein PILCRDRAFT_705051 [Piloderma croceum F 1598]|uniref:Cytochrome P450 n=1 Tax=Piloderma croceum (strain F 1598) TaxID=765440 RepID=A0A0C3AKI2_PILCF|nr:hypothetical protein PILCRDRAFT_705051 [Piloderma croceum F 1598]
MFGSIVRPVLKDTSVPTAEGGRLYVRKGDVVLGQCREMHRAFDRPEEFIFDRVKKARQVDKVNLGYIPFAGGKGICPGRFLAYSEIKIVVLAMLQTFDLEPLSPFPELSPEGILGFGIAKPSRPWYVQLRRCTNHA